MVEINFIYLIIIFIAKRLILIHFFNDHFHKKRFIYIIYIVFFKDFILNHNYIRVNDYLNCTIYVIILHYS